MIPVAILVVVLSVVAVWNVRRTSIVVRPIGGQAVRRLPAPNLGPARRLVDASYEGVTEDGYRVTARPGPTGQIEGFDVRPPASSLPEIRLYSTHRSSGDFESGDEQLDGQISIEPGDSEIWLRARLDEQTRRAILAAAGGNNIEWVEGRLRQTSPLPIADSREGEQIVERLLCMIRALTLPIASMSSALFETGTTDPVDRVRWACLRMLLERFPEDERAGEAAQAGVLADDPVLRLMAAQGLGPDGFDFALTVVPDRRAELPLRVEAARWLAKISSLRAVEGLVHTLGILPVEVLIALVDAVEWDASVGEALSQAASTFDNERAKIVADRLVAAGLPSAETALVGLLNRADAELQCHAASSLAQVGDQSCLEALRAVQPASRRAQRAIAAAIQQVCDRLGRAGGLSLARLGDTGGLSVAGDVGGLSISDE